MKIERVNLKCVNCGEESEQEVIYSSHSFGAKQHLDCRFDNGQVVAHIQECPHCHYSNIDIARPSKNAKQVYASAKYQEILNSKFDDKIKNYLKAALVNDKDKEDCAAQLYLYATWCFEDKKDYKNATKYRKLAYKNLIKLAKKEDNGDIYIQCIDLLRKNKEFDKAKELLVKVRLDLFNVDYNLKLTDEYIAIKNIVKFEEKLIANKDSADHLLEESEARMSFVDFNCLFMEYSKNLTSHSDVSIYAPIVYNMKNEFFDAVVKYLRTGEQENLVYDEYSTDKIIKAYWVEELDYIKAVVILDNIEKLGDNGCYVFRPYEVE